MDFHGTVYVESDGNQLHLKNNTLSVADSNIEIPLKDISGIVIKGRTTITTELLMNCIECGITITLLDYYGNYRTTLHPDIKGNVETRHKQYGKSLDKVRRLNIASDIILRGKMINQLNVLKKHIYNHGSSTNIDKAVLLLNQTSKIVNIKDIDELLGYEGVTSKYYFECMNDLILNKEFTFIKREYNPPTDELNAMLSYAYGLLRHDIEKYIQLCGLDPYVSFIHSERSGRKSLALDLMEEFRPWISDRIVLDLINRKQVRKEQFIIKDSATYCNEEVREKIIYTYENKKKTELDYNKKNVNIEKVIENQIRQFVRVMQDKETEYKPFIWG